MEELHGQIINSETFPGLEEFAQIPAALFEMEPDHNYPYEFLLKRAEVSFREEGGRILAIIEHHYRLKVYSDDPIYQAEAALIGIPFYYHDNMEEITFIEGATHHPDGSASALHENDIRTAELNSRYMIKEFIMPDVEKGSVIEYRYETHRRYIEELPDFYFSHRVPVKLAHITINNENYLRFDAVDFNIDFEVSYHEEKTDTSSIPLVFTYQRPEPVSREHWYAYDIPAIDDEVYISSVDDLRGKLKFQIDEFGRPRQPLENSWEFVTAQIRRGPENPFDIVDQLNEQKNLGMEIARQADSHKSASDTIFHYLNQKVTFNGVHMAFPNTPIEGVLNEEPSDQASINLVLLAMLRGAGIDAWPVYLSGRNFGRINKEFPSLYQFNQMIIAAETDSGNISLMDASFSNSRPNLIPVGSYNEIGLLFRHDGFEWIDIEPEHSVFDLDVDLIAELTDEGDLMGTFKLYTSGYPAQEIRDELSAQMTPELVLREAFFDRYTDIFFTNTEVREIEPDKYTLMLSTDFLIEGFAISFREGLQFSPMIVGYLHRNPFEENERQSPVILDAPEMLKVNYEITLPQGYVAEVAQRSMRTDMRGATLREQYDFGDRSLNYSFEVNISNREFSSDEYRELRRLYDRWVFLSNDEWFVKPGTDL